MPLPVLIALEGADGTGKSTQFKLLSDWVKSLGHPVTSCVEPGGTPLGQKIREILLHGAEEMSSTTETFLFMASRSELFRSVIIPAVNRGEIVITDRSILSTIVYQGHAGDMPISKIIQTGAIATRGMLPNLILLLDAPDSVTSTRGAKNPDRIERKGEAFRRQVRTGFLMEAKNNPDMVKLIDASRSVQEVHEAIKKQVKGYLESAGWTTLPPESA